MNHRAWSLAFVMMLVLSATAWSQSNSPSTTGTADVPGVLTTAAADAATTAGQLGIKKQLRSELAQLIDSIIHGLFSDVRTSLGLPAVPADPTTDPIAILESAVTDALNNVLTQ